MKEKIAIFISLILFTIFVQGGSVFALTKLEADKVRQQIIADSIKKYKGTCPCPYSKMKDGRSCGKFSAYSKKGAKKPICYVSDVTTKMIESYKK